MYKAKAIEYFNEAIRKENDFIAMYYLANSYIYEEENKQDISKPIELLVRSANMFYHSLVLLSLLFVSLSKYDLKSIKDEMNYQQKYIN